MANRIVAAGQRAQQYRACFGVTRACTHGARALLSRSGHERVTARWSDARAPIHLRLGSSDVDTFVEVLVDHEYDFRLRRPPRFVIDAGANIGLTSIWFAARYPDATIVALEPDEANFELLALNSAPYANVHPVRAALWKEVTEVSLVDPGLGPWAFQVTDDASARAGTQLTPATTVPALMDRFGFDQVDLLKLDIEGSEKEVLESSAPWIDRVDAVVVELHDRFKPGCTEAFELALHGHPVRESRHGTVFAAHP
jgi:FkbM family methyltransferase